MPMLEKNVKNVFWPLFGPIFRPKLVKMTQNYFYRASDAKLFPTRGHMPMFERNYENWYIWSQMACRALFGPFLGPNWSK